MPDELPADDSNPQPEPPEDKYEVLDLFGMKLSVRNPRLAEVLTAELGARPKATVEERPTDIALLRAEVAQAIPHVVLSPHTPHDEDESRARTDFRARANAAATALGFTVEPNGIWESPTGVKIFARTVDRPVTLAAAANHVEMLSSLAHQCGGDDCVALFVVDTQENADVFRVAIRHRHAYDRIRTVTLCNLQFIRSLLTAGVIDHAGCVILLAPVEEIDIGEILSIVRHAASEDRE